MCLVRGFNFFIEDVFPDPDRNEIFWSFSFLEGKVLDADMESLWGSPSLELGGHYDEHPGPKFAASFVKKADEQWYVKTEVQWDLHEDWGIQEREAEFARFLHYYVDWP